MRCAYPSERALELSHLSRKKLNNSTFKYPIKEPHALPVTAGRVWKRNVQVLLGGINQDAERLLAIPAGIDALPISGDPLHENPLLPLGGRSGRHDASPNSRPDVLASLTECDYLAPCNRVRFGSLTLFRGRSLSRAFLRGVGHTTSLFYTRRLANHVIEYPVVEAASAP